MEADPETRQATTGSGSRAKPTPMLGSSASTRRDGDHRRQGGVAGDAARPDGAADLPDTPLFAEPLVSVAPRFIAYTLLLFAFTLSLPIIVGADGDIAAFSEDGPIEWTQWTLLVLAAALFFSAAARRTELPQVALLLGLLVSVAAIRELDSLLDAWLPVVGWKLPAFLVLAGAAERTWRNRASLPRQLERLVSYRAFPVLWAGFVVAVPFAQLVGHGNLLQALMGDDYTRDYKRVVEETGELVGYALILIGSLELLWQERYQRTARRRAGPP